MIVIMSVLVGVRVLVLVGVPVVVGVPVGVPVGVSVPVRMRMGMTAAVLGFIESVRVGVSMTVVGHETVIDARVAIDQRRECIPHSNADDARDRGVGHERSAEIGVGIRKGCRKPCWHGDDAISPEQTESVD